VRAKVPGVSVQKPTVVLHFQRRANNFHRTANDLTLLDRSAYAPAIGLLSVHACIALTDALLVSVGQKQAKPDDHGEAARRLRAWCSATQVPEGAIKHFEWLLDKKSRFSYGREIVGDDELLLAKVKKDQFFAWASMTFPLVVQLKEDDRA
jgi:hypothetical protein